MRGEWETPAARAACTSPRSFSALNGLDANTPAPPDLLPCPARRSMESLSAVRKPSSPILFIEAHCHRLFSVRRHFIKCTFFCPSSFENGLLIYFRPGFQL